MSEFEAKMLARNLMDVHGLRAQAVVQERIAESRLQGDRLAMERWENVQAAIAELRRTGRHEIAAA